MDGRVRAFLRFALLSALAFCVVAGLVWAMAFEERSARQLYLEYEAFRASMVMLESFRENPGRLLPVERVLGFGAYRADGSSLIRIGSAPAEIRPKDLGSPLRVVRPERGSLIIERLIGPDRPGPPGFRGMHGGMMRGLGPPGTFIGPDGPEISGPPPQGAPRAIWVEYGLGGFQRERIFLYSLASLVTLALAALYVFLLVLFRRNTVLRENEARSHELVQLGGAARTLVHEIKNPLGIIRVQAASLRRMRPGTEPEHAIERAAAAGTVIDGEVLRLASLADKIRDFLKGGEGETRDLDLSPWLRDFARRYRGGPVSAGEEGVGAIALGELAGAARVRADPERLSQALDNLVRNAREAAPNERPEIALVCRGKAWEISVADRGPGIPQEHEERIFEPFFTTKEKGSGIGLALARRIARAAGGDLVHRSRPGGGSVFALTLPALPGKN